MIRTLFYLLFLAAALAQQERPKLPSAIQTLVDSAPGAPPELGADILLTLVEQGAIHDTGLRVEIIEQAFDLAGQAKFPYLEAAAVSRARHTDSQPGIRRNALSGGLSRLGLRTRAVRAALLADKAKARELFERVTLGPFPGLTCDDPVAPSLREYYDALREVALNAFSPEEIKEELHLRLIESAVRGVSIPRQLEPVAMLVADFPMPTARRAELAGAYAAALKQMNADPRSFGADSIGSPMLHLAAALKDDGSSALPLADALRSYLVRHLRGSLCAETVDPKEGLDAQRKLVENDLNQLSAGVEGHEPLRFESLTPESIEGRARFADYWTDERSRKIMASYRALRFGTKEQQEEYNQRPRRKDGLAHFLPEETRRTAVWEAQAREFLHEVDGWRKNAEDQNADLFHQVSLNYRAVLDIVPPGALYDTVLRDFVGFLKSSPMERESPPEWLLHVKRLIRMTDATLKHLQHVRDEVRANGSLAMSLYAELDRLRAERAWK